MDAEVESVMASSQDQREEELQVSNTDVLPWNRLIIYLFFKIIGILNKSCRIMVCLTLTLNDMIFTLL